MEEASFAGRTLRVFHRDALWRPLEDDDPPESFYDFTEEDFYRVVKGYQTPDPVLKTKAIRDREEQEAAEKLGPVCVRYLFPQGLICETRFSALDSLHALFLLASQLVEPDLEPELQLYTTPPKRLLQDQDMTLYQANLVPHVLLFVEFKSEVVGVSGLKPEVLALREEPQPAAVSSPVEEIVEESQQLTPEKRSANTAPSVDEEKRVPKWFKLGGGKK